MFGEIAKSDPITPVGGYRHLDLEHDQLLPVAQIYRDRTGKRLNPATLWRWVRGTGNQGIRLEAVVLQGCWHSTPRAFAGWLTDVATARLASPVAEMVPTERDERTTRKLRAAGLIK